MMLHLPRSEVTAPVLQTFLSCSKPRSTTEEAFQLWTLPLLNMPGDLVVLGEIPVRAPTMGNLS